LIASGCVGTLSCNAPQGQRCSATVGASTETCNDLDDDCNGIVDVDASMNDVCGCTPITDPNAARAYKLCTTAMPFATAACGPGYRLAKIDSMAEQTFVASINDEPKWIGLYQRDDAVSEATSWFWIDGTALAYSAWQVPEPNDAPTTGEATHEENCAIMDVSDLWNDLPCASMRQYLCEEL
jgi:hypothetical protein